MLVFTFGIRADDKTIVIEFEQRSESLPTGVSASGAVVSGGFNERKGGFYWMPTTGIIFGGGVGSSSSEPRLSGDSERYPPAKGAGSGVGR